MANRCAAMSTRFRIVADGAAGTETAGLIEQQR